jgi:SPX domain protein involved in polyphosphate accumulation
VNMQIFLVPRFYLKTTFFLHFFGYIKLIKKMNTLKHVYTIKKIFQQYRIPIEIQFIIYHILSIYESIEYDCFCSSCSIKSNPGNKYLFNQIIM